MTKHASKIEWQLNNREKNRAYVAAYRARNPGVEAEYKAEWKRNNRGKEASYYARYRAAKRQATPTWADKAVIQAIYQRAAKLTRDTGIKYEVDHILPLSGKDVSGLHVENNLRVIPRAHNLRKGNRRE